MSSVAALLYGMSVAALLFVLLWQSAQTLEVTVVSGFQCGFTASVWYKTRILGSVGRCQNTFETDDYPFTYTRSRRVEVFVNAANYSASSITVHEYEGFNCECHNASYTQRITYEPDTFWGVASGCGPDGYRYEVDTFNTTDVAVFQTFYSFGGPFHGDQMYAPCPEGTYSDILARVIDHEAEPQQGYRATIMRPGSCMFRPLFDRNPMVLEGVALDAFSIKVINMTHFTAYSERSCQGTAVNFTNAGNLCPGHSFYASFSWYFALGRFHLEPEWYGDAALPQPESLCTRAPTSTPVVTPAPTLFPTTSPQQSSSCAPTRAAYYVLAVAAILMHLPP